MRSRNNIDAPVQGEGGREGGGRGYGFIVLLLDITSNEGRGCGLLCLCDVHIM